MGTNDKMYPLINNMIIIAAVNRDLKKRNKPSSAKRFKAERSHQKSVHAILHKILSAKPHSFKEYNKSVTPSLLFSMYGPDLPTKLKSRRSDCLQQKKRNTPRKKLNYKSTYKMLK